MSRLSRGLLAVTLWVLIGPVAFGEGLPAALKNDFTPVEGYVLLVQDGAATTDNPGPAELKIGDLLTLYREGAAIVHPVTGEKLGSKKETLGYGRIAQAEEKLAHLEFLPGVKGVQPGDRYVRFSGLVAECVAEGEASEGVCGELRRSLSHLNWGAPREGRPGLQFSVAVGGGAVIVRSEGRELARYAMKTVLPADQNKTMVPLPDGLVTEVGRLLLDREPVGLVEISGPGESRIALSFDKELRVMTAMGSRELGRVKFPRGYEAVWIDAYRGRLEEDQLVCVTAKKGDGLQTLVYRFDSQSSPELIQILPMATRVVEAGSESIILGQSASREAGGFDVRIRKLTLHDGKLISGDNFTNVGKWQLYGWALSASGMAYALDDADHLKVVDREGKVLWRGGGVYGGNERNFEYSEDVGGLPERRRFFLGARILLEGDGAVIVGKNEGSRLFANARNFDRGNAVALRWNGITMEEIWSTPTVEAYLTDIALGDFDGDGDREFCTLFAVPAKGDTAGRGILTFYKLPGD